MVSAFPQACLADVEASQGNPCSIAETCSWYAADLLRHAEWTANLLARLWESDD